MTVTDRLAHHLITVAARRWPADLRDDLAQEWHAELAHAPRKLSFAANLAVAPAVDESGGERAKTLAVPAALTLLAAALFNVAHLAQGRFGPLAGGGALVVAAAVMVRAGRGTTLSRVLLLGTAMYAFLLAGNQVAVMPFMGWIDLGPAVLAWTVLTALTVVITRRLPSGGWRVLAAVGGSLLALDVGAAAGSVHAATALGLDLSSAPLWFPLSLSPVEVPGFGAFFADGTASLGSLQQAGPAFHASDVLLGNASAMIGPLALCSVAVVAGLFRRVAEPVVRESRDPVGTVALGVVAGLGGLAAGEVLRRSGGAAEFTLHRLVDNSAVFGFGFLAGPVGRTAVALLVGLLAVQLCRTERPAS